MPIKIYNSLTKQKEEFKPLREGEVKMYVCGPTVYDEPHIGHLRSAYVFDVMRRYMEYSGYKVKFVRNVTDVDDKIIEKAKESKPADLLAETLAVSDKYLKLYKDDLRALGILEPTVEPKATGHIQDMQWLIGKLVESGKAYVSEGDVYFAVNDFKGYGKLSHQNKDAMLQNVRVDKNEKKRDALDFALWKKAKEGEPFWESPWGKGRPGWHIECSAMSMKYLGETFDIHGGGRDLIFPHHENEIAQSEAVTGTKFANYWIHHGLITVNEQKMSKSLKNYITLKSLATQGPHKIEELKFLFLGTHYSAPLDYSEEKMLMQKSIRDKFIEFISKAGGFKEEDLNFKQEWIEKSRKEIEPYKKSFEEALSDDFNTPQAMTAMHEMVNFVYKNWSESMSLISESKKLLQACFKILGLSFQDALNLSLKEEIQLLVNEREEARKRRDFAKSDEIRIMLTEKYKVKLIDEKNGVRWVTL